MLSKNTTLTIMTKFGILLSNFALVVFSTRIWGSEGRGEIALVLANISIINIFSNIFCGSTVAYHASRIERDSLLSISFTGAIFVSLAGAGVFSIFFGPVYFLPLFLIALLMSLTTSVSSWWLGRNNIKMYNFLTFLNPLFILIAFIILYFMFKRTGLNTYFSAYYIGLGIVLISGISRLLSNGRIRLPEITLADARNILTYGLSNEFNYLIQFLNYRLSYYFIATMLSLSSLGLFSVVVSISEAVWIISRSMSAVHFSNVINSDDQLKNRNETIAYAKQSLLISALLLMAGILIPDHVYRLIFGDEFTGIRRFLLYMIPGVIAIAVSNLYGHYFAGTGKLKILRNKALLGLAASLIFLPLLIKKYQLTGVCISLNISYLISAFYLWFVFHKEARTGNVRSSDKNQDL
jgi:O-antigen/teichoic acid export membrane protein